MSQITVTLPDNSTHSYDSGVTPQEIAENIGSRLAQDALAAQVNGESVDLNVAIEADAEVAILTGDSPEGHEVLLHSTAHLMAHAVKELFPEAKVTIGPAIENRFYYDFDIDGTFSDDDLVNLILESSEINDDDILVFSQKIISKNEGRILSLSSVKPSLLADGIASSYGKDPRLVELILSESKRIVRMENGIIIVETNHGFVCANAGIDESNVQDGYATLLPDDPDKSANLLKDRIKQKTGKHTAVIISDTFGRPFRLGQTDVAIGIAGLEPILDYNGKPDTFGKIMQVTAIAVADEICSASELVMGKVEKCPIAIVRNYDFSYSDVKIQKILRSDHDDLFR